VIPEEEKPMATAVNGDRPQPAPEHEPALLRTADAAEGLRAFAEKRVPNWQAR
jgi:hypothetical protein